ncbi:hypothetical protein [Candidatus Erwinia dacicola]|uniref:Uncharacterized protein n=1 Tax=Candidatus Erwinia dacicola TaxID=252393 RepID=A0A1E7Z2S9_9GAMM|nr:hypothetical protein [Candidatus Erwinia dacicola]OFC63053.1 hypothetical protein BBW68_07190 [Candidatus Erwinia dacicola]
MSVKRYQPAPFNERVLHASDDGEYVKYDDYAALEAKCSALAAENAGLKVSRKNLAEFIHDELNADYPLNMDVETPATDAFFAEVRASAFNDLCAEFVKHKALASLDDRQKVTVFEATEALLHCAEQLDTQFRKGVQS